MNKKFWCSVSIVLLIMGFLALPFTSWGFVLDDFGFLYHAKSTSISNIFAAHDIAQTFFPPNFAVSCPSWLAAFYRPLQFVYFAFEEMVFGINPYYFLLFMVFLHALNSVIIFTMFASVVSCSAAYGATLLFAFHPTLFKDMGILFNQIYLIDLLCLLLCTLLLWRFMRSGKWWCYLLSCSIFFMQLFAKETLVVLPLWVALLSFVWQTYEHKSTVFVAKLRCALILSSGYWAALVTYFVLRWWVFSSVLVLPSTESLSTKLIAFLVGQKERFFVWVTYACDIFGISFVVAHGKMLKTGLLIVLISLLLWPFVARKKIIFFVFLVLSMLLFTWPSVLLFHQFRYLYIGLPFLMLAVAYATDFYSKKYYWLRVHLALAFCLVIAASATMFVVHQKKKETVFHMTTTAFANLASDKRCAGKAIIFVGLPLRWFAAGTAQAVWLLSRGEKNKVYYDIKTFLVRQYEGSLPWYGYYQDSYNVSVERVEGGVRVVSQQQEQLFFEKMETEKISLGRRIVNQTNAEGLPCAITFLLDQQWQTNDSVFVTWDYQQNKFKIVD
ncbi:hypothetical protein K2X40_00400 [Candidatus Babeliales bacterium]|nr:hypothetical protein [Candidatus Babeliales bacterium]